MQQNEATSRLQQAKKLAFEHQFSHGGADSEFERLTTDFKGHPLAILPPKLLPVGSGL